MTQVTDVDACIERYVRRFRTYDRAVDVVSAFEALFTRSNDLPPTVRHFERFPTVLASGDEVERTPDFSVAFTDETALIGEVARIALRDESVDSLCEQLAAYDQARQVPTSATAKAEIQRADVLLLVPADVGPDAVDRIIRQRLESTAHWYNPSAPPCILQFLFDEGRYHFQRLPTPGNGTPNDGARGAGLGDWLSRTSTISVQPSFFMGFKAEKAFMNDPPDDLYLATILWTKIFPLLEPDPAVEGFLLRVRPGELAVIAQRRFGRVRTGDMKRALTLLETAQLALKVDDGWLVGWQPLRRSSVRDIAQVIARRACKPPGTHILDRLGDAIDLETGFEEQRLFQLDD
jgi:hypothetical protein